MLSTSFFLALCVYGPRSSWCILSSWRRISLCALEVEALSRASRGALGCAVGRPASCPNAVLVLQRLWIDKGVGQCDRQTRLLMATSTVGHLLLGDARNLGQELSSRKDLLEKWSAGLQDAHGSRIPKKRAVFRQETMARCMLLSNRALSVAATTLSSSDKASEPPRECVSVAMKAALARYRSPSARKSAR